MAITGQPPIVINIDRSSTTRFTLNVSFDAQCFKLAFPCTDPDTELHFGLTTDCQKKASEELLTASKVADLIEKAVMATELNPTAGAPEPRE